MKRHQFLVFTLFVLFLKLPLHGQNLKTSHLMWNLPLYNNAALSHSNYSHITADYRKANLSEGVNFSSALVWMDCPILINNKNTGAFFVMFENEKSGSDIDFNGIKANIAFSKKIMLNRLSHVNFGLGVGYRQFDLSLSGLSTSSQFIPGVGFDTSLPNGESSDFYKTSYFTINSGLFYQATNYSHTQLLKIGLSAHNLNKQLRSWGDTNSKLPVQYSAQLQYLTFTNPQFAVGPDLVIFNEENKINGVGGLSLRYFINNPTSIENEEGKHLNAFVRVATQKKEIVGFQYKSEQYVIGFSYDIPFGDLTQVYGNAFEVLFSFTPEVKGWTKNKRSRRKRKTKSSTKQVQPVKSISRPIEKENKTDSIDFRQAQLDSVADSVSIARENQEGKVRAGEITTGEIHFTPLVSQVYFVFGSSDLDENSKNLLQEVYERYLKNGEYKISVTGHTDNVGSEEDNKKLSVKRAEIVYEYLLKLGVSGDNIQVAGKGEEEPVAANDTREGRARNRRVEIALSQK